ncbi:hypothetical protein V6N12_053519 [Hibiscus sabdariffa]|uniref:Uncharacterized protein n=1 Tax=Hibiscus sabdariffa TaxID=183260 RepID=A0ABR2D7V0_9ROSI
MHYEQLQILDFYSYSDEVRRNELESTRIQNFVNFSSHKTTRTEQSKPSNSKSVTRESTVIDSYNTPTMTHESRASQAMSSSTETTSGGDNNNACVYTNMNVVAAVSSQSAGVSIGANKDNLTTCEGDG